MAVVLLNIRLGSKALGRAAQIGAIVTHILCLRLTSGQPLTGLQQIAPGSCYFNRLTLHLNVLHVQGPNCWNVGSALYCCNYCHVSSCISYFEVTWRLSKDRFPPKVCDPETRRNLWRHGVTLFCYIDGRRIYQCRHWILCIVDSTLPPIYGSGSLCVPYVLSTCSCLFESCNVTTRFVSRVSPSR